jgi:hypothetical protein
LNEISDENVSEYSSDHDGAFDNVYTQLVTTGTHVIGDSRQEEIVDVGF